MYEDPRIAYFSKWFATAVNSPEVVSVGCEGPHVRNLVHALSELGCRDSSPHAADYLTRIVLKFQKKNNHSNVDGMVGPGTRRMITSDVLKKCGPEFFEELEPTFTGFYQFFISYARADSGRVDKLDQWLRDHGVGVKRDIYNFRAGHKIPGELEKCLHLSDKAVIVHSATSKTRDWPVFERFAAEEVEKLRGVSYLIYLMLDGSLPPTTDPNRIYVDGSSKPLKDVGRELIHAIGEAGTGVKPYVYDEDVPL